MMHNAYRLVSYLSPELCPYRQKPLACAIQITCSHMQEALENDIHFTRDIYPEVAINLRRSQATVERSIFRAVDDCWMDGANPYLFNIIGRIIPAKPKPSIFIMYCSFFLVYERPYHAVKGDPAIPLPF